MTDPRHYPYPKEAENLRVKLGHTVNFLKSVLKYAVLYRTFY